jgi:hypothetical protein
MTGERYELRALLNPLPAGCREEAEVELSVLTRGRRRFPFSLAGKLHVHAVRNLERSS